MADGVRKDTAELIDLHRRYWAGGFDQEVMALVMTLHRAGDALRERTKTVWAKCGLTAAEFDVLATLRRSPPPREMTPSDIRNSMLITSGGLTKAMSSLEDRGLLTRSRSELDQRIRPVRLSAYGKRMVERVMADLTSIAEATTRASLGRKEIVLLTSLLGKLEMGVASTEQRPAPQR